MHLKPYDPKPHDAVPWLTEYDVEYVLDHDPASQFGALSVLFISKLKLVVSDGWDVLDLASRFEYGGFRSYERWLKEQCQKARDAAPCEPEGFKVVEACAGDMKDLLRGIRSDKMGADATGRPGSSND